MSRNLNKLFKLAQRVDKKYKENKFRLYEGDPFFEFDGNNIIMNVEGNQITVTDPKSTYDELMNNYENFGNPQRVIKSFIKARDLRSDVMEVRRSLSPYEISQEDLDLDLSQMDYLSSEED